MRVDVARTKRCLPARQTSEYRRSVRLTLGAVAAAVLLAGCGGAKAPSVARVATTTTSTRAAGSTTAPVGTAGSGSSSGQTPEQNALKYARCMRANGVPNFPDPNANGGFTFAPGSGIDLSSPAYKAAQTKCEKLMGGVAAGTQTHPSAQWLAKMVNAAHCMRSHGVPNFPDPITTMPSPSVLGGSGQISDIEGAVFVFPAATIDTQSPIFIRAAKTCGFPLHNH
jgi:hypothetical protein